MVRFLWLRSVDIETSVYQAKIKGWKDRFSVRYISVDLIVIGQVPRRGKKVPKGVDMLAFFKQMLYGLLQFTYMIGVTVSDFGLEKFVASVQDVIVYFKLKHRKL